MKAFATIVSALLAAQAEACMSDKACEGKSSISMCCYMNECVPSSNIGCSNKRMQIHEHLWSIKTKHARSLFAEEIKEKSSKVRECVSSGVYCVDYITELATDPGVFESLDGVGALKEM